MTPILTVENNTGNTVKIENELEQLAITYTSRDLAAGVTTLNVTNGLISNGTSVLVLIGVLGTDTAEIRTFSSGAAGTIIVSSATTFAHPKGEPVTIIPFDKVVIETATTQTGTYSVLVTLDIQTFQKSTIYQHTAGLTTTWYKVRFKNSVATIYSDYSVAVASSSFGTTTAGYLIESIRKSSGDASDLPDSFFLSSINDARNILNTDFGFGRVNEWRQEFEYPIQMLAGRNYVTLPTDIDFNETNRTLLNARYARQSVAANLPIAYVDKRRWNSVAYQNRYSTTTTAVLTGATSMVLTSTGDFPTSGTVFAATDSPTQDIITITYTGNNLATNTLTGVSGVTRDLPIDCQIWAYSTFSYPFFFTVFDGRLWFERPIPTALQGKNLYIDYYKKIVDITDMDDEVPEHYRDIYKNYLLFAIKKRRDNTLGEDDADYKRFIRAATNVLGNPYTGQFQIVIT